MFGGTGLGELLIVIIKSVLLIVFRIFSQGSAASGAGLGCSTLRERILVFGGAGLGKLLIVIIKGKIDIKI